MTSELKKEEMKGKEEFNVVIEGIRYDENGLLYKLAHLDIHPRAEMLNDGHIKM
jgi:hypothetical protein